MRLKFESLPFSMRQAAIFALGWRNRRLRYGGEYQEWKQFLAQSRSWTLDQIEGWQRRRLAELCARARSGTAHYPAILPAEETLKQCASLRETLEIIPILEKSALRSRPEDFRNKLVKEVTVSSTSGSTGSPMRVGHDSRSIQRRFAFTMDHLYLAGIPFDAPSVRLSGRILCPVGRDQSRPWLYNAAERQLFLSSYHLDDLHRDTIANRLHALQPQLLDGYPSGILETLRLLKRAGRQLTSLKAIVTTAETLHPEMREELGSLSGVPVMDYYSASEGLPFIQQCPYGTYHVRWQSGIIEVDGGAGIIGSGDGELICTSFVQDRTPLIRYRTGDRIRNLDPSVSVCECGLSTPTVDSVEGRIEDLVYTTDGRALGMFTYRTLKNIPGLNESQVIQLDFDRFEVNLVPTPESDPKSLHAAIKENFERALGYPITLAVNEVTQLPRGANGKVRLVMSKVADAKKTAS